SPPTCPESRQYDASQRVRFQPTFVSCCTEAYVGLGGRASACRPGSRGRVGSCGAGVRAASAAADLVSCSVFECVRARSGGASGARQGAIVVAGGGKWRMVVPDGVQRPDRFVRADAAWGVGRRGGGPCSLAPTPLAWTTRAGYFSLRSSGTIWRRAW